MKKLSGYVFTILFVGFIFMGCSDQQAPTAISAESNITLSKATVVEGSFDFNYDDADGFGNPVPPYTDCVTGASMQNHGIIKANYRIVSTPSGHYIETGHVDYKAYGEVTLVNESTGEVWKLKNGKNPWSWIEYQNGSFRFHYHWNEVYTLDKKNLHLHLKGFLTVDKNGIVTKNLETYSCN